ncbi:MAG: tetratricopeptide repeat protein [Anaerovoracaceae bacterium]|jgi:TPR repeat protein
MASDEEKKDIYGKYSTLEKALAVDPAELKKDALDGKPDAMNAMGMKHEAQQQLRRAARWYMLAGFAGSSEGIYNYGKSLFWGWNDEPDYKTAHQVFRIARERGCRKGACYFLAVYAEKGILDKPDYEKAIALYSEGALDGDYRCYRELGRIYAEGKITEEDPEKAYYNFMMAGAIGDPVSVTNMALFYEEGYGIEKNMDRAVELYKMAADAGEENAIEALERLGVESGAESGDDK